MAKCLHADDGVATSAPRKVQTNREVSWVSDFKKIITPFKTSISDDEREAVQVSFVTN